MTWYSGRTAAVRLENVAGLDIVYETDEVVVYDFVDVTAAGEGFGCVESAARAEGLVEYSGTKKFASFNWQGRHPCAG